MDTKFTREFKDALAARGVQPHQLRKVSPNLNGRCERFVQPINFECLSKFIIFGRRHLDYLLTEFRPVATALDRAWSGTACYQTVKCRTKSNCSGAIRSRCGGTSADSFRHTNAEQRSSFQRVVCDHDIPPSLTTANTAVCPLVASFPLSVAEFAFVAEPGACFGQFACDEIASKSIPCQHFDADTPMEQRGSTLSRIDGMDSGGVPAPVCPMATNASGHQLIGSPLASQAHP